MGGQVIQAAERLDAVSSCKRLVGRSFNMSDAVGRSGRIQIPDFRELDAVWAANRFLDVARAFNLGLARRFRGQPGLRCRTGGQPERRRNLGCHRHG